MNREVCEHFVSTDNKCPKCADESRVYMTELDTLRGELKAHKEMLEAVDDAWKLTNERAEAAEQRVRELTQEDPCWYDMSVADAFRMWKADRERVRDLEAKWIYELNRAEEFYTKLSRYEQAWQDVRNGVVARHSGMNKEDV